MFRRFGSRDSFLPAPARLIEWSSAAVALLAMAIPVPASAATPAEMQLQSGVNAAIDAARSSASQLTVQQNAAKAITVWNKLNVRAGESLIIDQKGNRSWEMLAKINDIAPSVIAGKVQADGSLYMINTNGIIFANGAQVNVGSLTASSLNLAEDRFLAGLLARQDGTPTFDGTTGFVKVMEDAAITTGKNGRVMLLAPTVLNKGRISTPEGQTILAAGQKVYLAASGDANLRGLLVEVDNPGVNSFDSANPSFDNPQVEAIYKDAEYDKLGHATNLAQGKFADPENPGAEIERGLFTARGNATMIGYAVNQMGRVSATTSVSLNGSIRLLAQDTKTNLTDGSGNIKVAPTRGGRLQLGANSLTEVSIESGGESSSDAQPQQASQIKLVGKQIHLQGDAATGNGAAIHAPAGKVEILAAANPGTTTYDNAGIYAEASGVRVLIDPNVTVNTAGETETVSVSRNIVQAELRGDELKDSPLQRNSFLRGQKVWVDVNKGTPLADVSGYIGQVGRSARERAATGGSISVKSEGDIVFRNGASFDVSGGAVQYTPGNVKTTLLISDGKLIDISEATPDRIYQGFADRVVIRDEKWGINQTIFYGENFRYDPGYVEGKDAGKVLFQAPVMVLNGSLKGATTLGEWQRTAGKLPKGAQLQVGRSESDLALSGINFKLLSDVTFSSQPRLAAGFKLDDTLAQGFKDVLALNRDWLDAGFNRVAVYSNGGIRIEKATPLALAPGGSLTLMGKSVDIAGDILAPAGSILARTPGTGTDITVRDGVRIDASGMWVNDALNPAQARGAALIDAGSVDLIANRGLHLGAGSLLAADGGAWIDVKDKLAAGKGGALTLVSNNELSIASDTTDTSPLELKGELRAYGIENGGSLALTAGAVRIGAPADKAGELSLAADFFGKGGFASYDITGFNGLVVAKGVDVQARTGNLQLPPTAAIAPSGTPMRNIGTAMVLPDIRRKAANLTLRATNAYRGKLEIAEGAQVSVDPGGKLALAAASQLTVHGGLRARGGDISISMSGFPPGGYDASQSIWLGGKSVLDASGVAVTALDRNGLVTGRVLNGGRVTLDANVRHLVAEAGSEINVSGARAYLDIPTEGNGLGRQVASDAGTLSVSAGEGLYLNATLLGRGGDGTSRGGTFKATLDQRPYNIQQNPETYPSTERVLAVGSTDTALPAGLAPGAALSAGENGKGYVNLARVVEAGFEQAWLKSQDRLVVSDVKVPRSANMRVLSLDAPRITVNGMVDLAASYVRAGNADTRYQNAVLGSAPGGAELWLRGDFIDLIGKFAIDQAKAAHFESAGDIRFIGSGQDGTQYERLTGRMDIAGNVDFVAAQLYPASRTSFEVNVGNGGAVSIKPVVGTAETPLSADGALTIRANSIEQAGVIRAPFGSIALEAEDWARPDGTIAPGSVTLQAGSLTSVAALTADGKELLIPYGRTDNQLDWLYDLGVYAFDFSAAPQKQVRLRANKLSVNSGAQIDISAGGDLFAYENFPGPGGSRDVLNDPGVYAILPGFKGRFAPFDAMQEAGFGLTPGQSVYLADAPGIAAGVHTLLPAHYALLPGAYAIRLAPNTTDLLPGFNRTRPDGSQIVPGFYTDSRYRQAGDVRDARWNGFELRSRDLVRTQSELSLSYASSFLPQVLGATRGFAQDAGRLSLVGNTLLSYAGTLAAASKQGYAGAEIDFAANKLLVADGGASVPVDVVRLDAELLAGLPVDSLFLGGVRKTQDDGSIALEVVSQEVSVDTANWVDAAKQPRTLSKRELMLAATDKLTVAAGSRFAAQGARRAGVTAYATTGDGAFLRLGADDASFTRSGAIGKTGTLRVAGATNTLPAASLTTSRSAIFDATLSSQMEGDLKYADTQGKAVAGALAVGGERISLMGAGVAVPANGGLVFTQADMDAFSRLDALTLTSYSGFDFHGDARLGVDANGNITMKSLALKGGALSGHGGANNVAQVGAGKLEFSNTGKAADAAQANGTGQLKVLADSLVLGEGSKQVRGFAKTLVDAGEIIGSGSGETQVLGAAELTVGGIGAATGAEQKFIATGALELKQKQLASAWLAPQTLGAAWTFQGSSLTHGANIKLPSGSVTLQATGGDVKLVDGGRIDVAGANLQFFDQVMSTPGGRVSLVADKGNVRILKGSRVDVSGTDEGDAGELGVSAPGGGIQVDTDSLRGGVPGNSPSRGGNFVLDVAKLDGSSLPDGDKLADFSALNRALNAGGFNESRALRVRGGDIMIPGSEKGDHAVKSRRFVLAADAGSIGVAGDVDASAPQGGFVGLYAKNGITVAGGSTLDVSGTDADAHGGTMELFAQDGSLALEQGASFKAHGAARDGKVHLRARRNGSDVQVTALKSGFSDVERILIEAYKAYDTMGNKSITAADVGTNGAWYKEAASFMSKVADIEKRLGVDKDERFQVTPGVEVRASGDIALSTDWSLHGWRYDPDSGAVAPAAQLAEGVNASGKDLVAGALTLRAGGNLNLNGSLSDGFAGAATTAALQGREGWSYRLVAGADTDQANPGAVERGTGNIALAAGKLVRTGTGDIRIAAGGNLDMSKAATSTIYTAGRKVRVADLGGFTPPPDKVSNKAFFTGFTERGGDIDIRLEGDALGYRPADAVKTQLVNNWLFRQGQLKADGSYELAPAWWVRFDNFQQGVGALGGGDIAIRAGGMVDNFSAVIPTQGWTAGATPEAAIVNQRGGGNLSVRAGGNIQSGLYYVARGRGDLRAGDSIVANRKVLVSSNHTRDLHTLLALGDGRFTATARRDLQLESVFNPTVLKQDSANASSLGALAKYRTYYLSYAPQSALSATALTGDLGLFNDGNTIVKSNSLPVANGDGTSLGVVFYPGNVAARAPEGGLYLRQAMGLHPSARGQLQLLAKQDIELGGLKMSDLRADETSTKSPSKEPFLVPHANALYQGAIYHAATPVHLNDPDPARIYALLGDIQGVRGESFKEVILAKPLQMQAGRDIRDVRLIVQNLRDDDVTRIEAGRDIAFAVARDANNQLESNDDRIEIGGPGALELIAGRNIELGNSLGVITRGNLINPALEPGGAAIRSMTGLGAFAPALAGLVQAIQAEYAAKGTVSDSLMSEARQLTANPNLQPGDAAKELAGVTPLTGAVSRLSRQIDQAIANLALTDELLAAHALSPAANDLLIQSRLLVGNEQLLPSQIPAALDALKAAPVAQQAARVREMVFEATRFAGRRATDTADSNEYAGNYDLGYKTIELAFPCIDCKGADGGQKYYAGDINGFFSQFRTQQGGAMDFLIPGGRWVVGLANVPESLLLKKASYPTDKPLSSYSAEEQSEIIASAASKLGVVSVADGRIRAVVHDDILVNQSRILTLTGSGMLLWSSEKDIDAGKGKKTVASVPPPVVTTDASGNVQVVVQGAATGSGIGVLQSIPGKPAEDAELYAPNGAIDAGDAGIRSAGGFRGGAKFFRNADNFQVAGPSVGIPAAQSVNLAANFAGGNIAGDAARASEDATKAIRGSSDEAEEALKRMRQAIASFRPSFISVEVVGFGD